MVRGSEGQGWVNSYQYLFLPRRGTEGKGHPGSSRLWRGCLRRYFSYLLSWRCSRGCLVPHSQSFSALSTVMAFVLWRSMSAGERTLSDEEQELHLSGCRKLSSASMNSLLCSPCCIPTQQLLVTPKMSVPWLQFCGCLSMLVPVVFHECHGW